MGLKIEFRPKPPLSDLVRTLIETEVRTWACGLSPADIGAVDAYRPWPLWSASRCRRVADTIVDDAGALWRPRLRPGVYASWDGRLGKRYRPRDILAGWRLDRVTPEHRAALDAGRLPDLPGRSDAEVPVGAPVHMRGLLAELSVGGVWDLPDVEYVIDPATDLTLHFAAPDGWVGVAQARS